MRPDPGDGPAADIDIDIDVVAEDPRWEAADLDSLARRAVGAALAHLGVGGPREVVVLGCDDARIAGLNEDFRGKARPTNVLSWPSADRAPAPGERPDAPDDVELGDIAIAWDTCAAEAQAAAIPLGRHVTHLLVHATLHLLGYDHETDADADLMERTETAILGTLGEPDPYA